MNSHLQHWRPQLRRAVMKARPEFFAWPRERQERRGAAMPAEDHAHFKEALLVELFGRTCATRAGAAAAADQLSLDEKNLLNETVLPLHGIGEDCFYLNESFADKESILDFETVRDYDENDYRFQDNARKEEDPDYSGRPWRRTRSTDGCKPWKCPGPAYRGRRGGVSSPSGLAESRTAALIMRLI